MLTNEYRPDIRLCNTKSNLFYLLVFGWRKIEAPTAPEPAAGGSTSLRLGASALIVLARFPPPKNNFTFVVDYTLRSV